MWTWFGVFVALLCVKDLLSLRAPSVLSPAWPAWVSLIAGLVLAVIGLAQSRHRTPSPPSPALQGRSIFTLALMACVFHAIGNLILVMRLASVWSLVGVILACGGLVLSLISLRSPTPSP